MSSRMCVYTVLTGAYDALLEQPVAAESTADFLCFTDDPSLAGKHWTTLATPRRFERDAARSSRAQKILGDERLREYDVTLYVDASVLLLQTPEQIVADLLPEDSDAALLQHSYRATVLDEFEAVLEAELDEAGRVHEQLHDYAIAHSDVLAMQPHWGGMIVRRTSPEVDRAMRTWWEHVLRYSRRDQLSLMVALSTTPGLAWRSLQLDNEESPYHRWPVAPERRHAMRKGAGTFGPLVEDVRRQAVRIDELEHRILELEGHALHLAWERAEGEAELRQTIKRLRRKLRRARGENTSDT